MRLSTKVLLWAWVVLLLILGSLVYGAYSRLNPDSLVAVLNEQVQRSYPDSKISIGKINYGFSIDFSLSLHDLTLVRAAHTLASAKEVELKIPWWVILLNKGNAQINVDSLDIFVSPNQRASAPAATGNKSEALSNKVEVYLPKYLMDAQYTLRAKNISIKELNTDRRLFTLSKLLVREFQYGKNSAFELNIPISITHKEKKYSSELWLFGDVTPEVRNWNLNYRGEFKTKDTAEGFEFDDLVLDGKSTFNPQKVDLTSTIDLTVERKKVGSGQIVARYDELQVEVKLKSFPLDFLNLIGDEIKNPFWPKIEGFGEGEVKFRKNFGTESSTSLSAKLHFPGQFSLSAQNKVNGEWHLDFENEKWQISFLTPKGELSFFRRAVLDFNNGLVSQYSQEIGFNGFDLDSALLTVDSLSATINQNDQPYHSTFISLKKCISGDKVVDGSFRYGISPYQKFYQAELIESSSKMKIDYVAKASVQNLRMEFNKLNWLPSFTFLQPFFTASSGTLDGKIEGQWNLHWSDGTWLYQLKADHLAQTAGEFVDLNQKLWDFFSIDSSPFAKRSWSGSIQKNNIKITSFVLDGSDPARLTGNLSETAKTKSYLTLTYPKNKKWKPVKKEVAEVFWKKETP